MEEEKERPALLSTQPEGARLLLYCYTLFILVTCLGFLFPGYYSWSLSFLRLLPNLIVFLLLGPAILSLYPLLRSSRHSITNASTSEDDSSPGKQPTYLSYFFAFIVLTLLLFFLKSKALVYGDGYMILSKFSSGQEQFINYQDYVKGLALLFHKYFFKFLTLFIPFTPGAGFALINSIGGAIGIIGIYRLCDQVTQNRASRFFCFVSALTSGAVIIFFGHIEYYTWAMSLSVWSLLFSVRYIKDDRGLLPMLFVSSLAVLFHILTLPFLIISLIAFAYHGGKTKGLPFGISFSILNISLLIASFVLALGAQLFDLPQWLMLIYPIDGVPYWFLSLGRLVDIANHVWLVAPIGCLLLLMAAFARDFSLKDQAIEIKLIGSAALWSFLVFFWVEPKLGAARDFDFTAFYAFPLTIWIVAAYLSRVDNSRLVSRALPSALIIMILALAPNLYEKLDSKRAAENLDSILWDSPHHQIDYGNARRAMVWGVAIMNEAELPNLSVRSFQKRLEAKPDDYASWFNLGQIYFDNGQLDSATYFFSKAVEFKPGNHIYLARLAEAESKTDKLDKAAAHIRQAAILAPTLYNARYLAGLILKETGDTDQAMAHFRVAEQLNSKAVGPLSYIGLIYYEQEIFDSAYNYLNRSLAKNPMNLPLYPRLIRTNIALGKLSEAAHVLSIYRQVAPEADDLDDLRSFIDELSKQ